MIGPHEAKKPRPDYTVIGPGQSPQFYLDQLAATGYTGWYDDNGVPAPWPDDFLDPDSGWRLAETTAITLNDSSQSF